MHASTAVIKCQHFRLCRCLQMLQLTVKADLHDSHRTTQTGKDAAMPGRVTGDREGSQGQRWGRGDAEAPHRWSQLLQPQLCQAVTPSPPRSQVKGSPFLGPPTSPAPLGRAGGGVGAISSCGLGVVGGRGLSCWFPHFLVPLHLVGRKSHSLRSVEGQHSVWTLPLSQPLSLHRACLTTPLWPAVPAPISPPLHQHQHPHFPPPPLHLQKVSFPVS